MHGIEWWPDPLLSFLDAIDVAQGDAQPFWVTVHAATAIKPGKYQGKITVKPRNSHQSTVHLSVEVRAFKLPEKQSLPTICFLNRFSLQCVYGSHRKIIPSWNPDFGTVDGRAHRSGRSRRACGPA